MGLSWMWICIGFFLCLMAGLEVGYRSGRRRVAAAEGEPSKGEGLLDSIVYALLGLLLSFSFSLAVGRFEARRHLIVEEANAVGTAYLRIDLLPSGAQPDIRKAFVEYADARLAFARDLSEGRDPDESIRATSAAQRQIWSLVMDAYQEDPHESSRIQMTPAMNQMFDLAATRTEASRTRLPWVILALLATLAATASLLGGSALGRRGSPAWGHRIAFCAILTFVMLVIADLDDPQRGLIRVDQANDVLRDVRSEMR